jgi:hypothetical protein
MVILVPLDILYRDSYLDMIVSNKVYFSIFFTDILIRNNTCFYKYGNLVKERKKIFKNYFKNHFFEDFLVLFIGFIF